MQKEHPEHEQARRSEAALVAFVEAWSHRIARLQRAHPRRWFVAGLSDEETRDALTLRLWERLREPPDPDDCPEGKDWGLWVVERELRVLRARFRMRATAMDLRELVLPERAPGLEQRWIEGETVAERRAASARAESRLGAGQRQWLAAMRASVARGELFAASDRPNLSAASRTLGKNRSSAQRAFKDLQAHFRGELPRSSGSD